MLAFLVLLIAYFVLLGLYAFENGTKHPVRFLTWTSPRVADWVPAVVAGVVVFALMLLWGGYGRLRHGLRRRRLSRRINAHESSISELRSENDTLRAEIARLRGRVEPVAFGPASPAPAGPLPSLEPPPVGPATTEVSGQGPSSPSRAGDPA